MDFARDGVAYLELRTTPKDLPSRGVTKESYCEAVLLGMHMGACLATHRLRHDGGGDLESDPAIVARLILSIDRRETAKEAKRTVKLAAYLRDVREEGLAAPGPRHVLRGQGREPRGRVHRGVRQRLRERVELHHLDRARTSVGRIRKRRAANARVVDGRGGGERDE